MDLTDHSGDIAMGFELGGLIKIAILFADVWAILKTFQSMAPTGTKALWIVIILMLPVLGVILWYFMGPRDY